MKRTHTQKSPEKPQFMARPPPGFDVDQVPVRREGHQLAGRPFGHGRGYPFEDRSMAVELAEVVFEVVGVPGEHVGPLAPFAGAGSRHGASG